MYCTHCGYRLEEQPFLEPVTVRNLDPEVERGKRPIVVRRYHDECALQVAQGLLHSLERRMTSLDFALNLQPQGPNI